MDSMTNIRRRMKNDKKAITPVIATIILIAVTLVLALVVGAYTFGLFGSNVKTVTLTSGNLFAGNLPTAALINGTTSGVAYISFSLNNPGAATSITGFTLTGASVSTTVVAYGCSSMGVSCVSLTSSPIPLNAGKVTSLNLYFGSTAGSITSGQTFNYVINLQNGQSVSGTFIAQ
jgi:flagellin-like protein